MSALSNFVLRKVHVLSQLPFHPSAGVGKFLSPKTCDLLIKLQSDRLEKVNRISQDNALSRLSLYQIIEKTQDDPNQAIVYNCASQAWNTDFFLQGLTPEPLAMTDKLIAAIETNFGSVAKFKEEFTTIALAMMGSGYVWLVKNPAHDRLKIQCTFNCSSPIFQSVSPLSLGSNSTFSNGRFSGNNSSNSTLFSAFLTFPSNSISRPDVNQSSAEQPIDSRVPAEAKALPLLGINMWEHAYILDYGLDREAYLKNFWNAVNWNRLAIMLNLY